MSILLAQTPLLRDLGLIAVLDNAHLRQAFNCVFRIDVRNVLLDATIRRTRDCARCDHIAHDAKLRIFNRLIGADRNLTLKAQHVAVRAGALPSDVRLRLLELAGIGGLKKK